MIVIGFGNAENLRFVNLGQGKYLIMATKKSGKISKKAKSREIAESGSKFSLPRIKQFYEEVKNEFGKIAWPDKKQTIGSTGVVVVLVFLISIYLGLVDFLLGHLIGLVIK